MQRSTDPWRILDEGVSVLALAYGVDRVIKHLAIEHFFRRPRPTLGGVWPRVTMIHPITRGTHRLADALEARAQLDYPTPIQHLFVCDAKDALSQQLCRRVLASKRLQGDVITVPAPPDAPVAHKIQKLRAALPRATGDIICCIDDDVAPWPDALRQLVPFACQPGVGAAFGMPNNTNWDTLWSSLLTTYVNANTFQNYAAQTYLVEPFRVLGQMVAYPRAALAAIDDLAGMEEAIDDDYAIAQQLHAQHLTIVQAPVIFDVDNTMPSAAAYHRQLKRWIVLPRQAMIATITPRQSIASLASAGVSFVVPGITLVLAVMTRRAAVWRALAAMVGIFSASYAFNERRYLRRRTPPWRWPIVLLGALLTPLHTLYILTRGGNVEWRGQRMHVQHDGRATLLSPLSEE